jgi:hypothetical protein
VSSDPVDVHRALQKAARELAHFADHGPNAQYLDAIDNLEIKLRAVRNLPPIQIVDRIADLLWRKNPNLGEVISHALAEAVVKELINDGVLSVYGDRGRCNSCGCDSCEPLTKPQTP